GHVLIIQKVTEIDFDAIDDWAAHKKGLEDEAMAYLRPMLPASARIVVQMSASAMTSHRFTLNDGGAMLGWEMAPDQLGDGRPDARGPVRGLYLVGQWTRPGGGITPVIVSAMNVARLITGESAAPDQAGREAVVRGRRASLVGTLHSHDGRALP